MEWVRMLGRFPYGLLLERRTEDPLGYEYSLYMVGNKKSHPSRTGWHAGGWSYDWQGIPLLPKVKSAIIGFPDTFFFSPHWIWENTRPLTMDFPPASVNLTYLYSSFRKEDFLRAIEDIRQHIYHGEVYQVNLACEFLWEGVIDPLGVYARLRQLSPMPFNYLFRWGNKYVIGASPERFLWHRDGMVIQQPIKGTQPRGQTPQEDQARIQSLLQDPKEKAENTMIVDLVRHEFYQFCKMDSVEVTEWAQVHTFSGLHHLISTIQGQLQKPHFPLEAVKYVFPPGSMTGAPKAAAMSLIDRYEPTGRGIYAGALGFIRPDKSFDFWVVIRSMVYDAKKKVLSFHVGSGITYDSDPEKEWQETLLKAEKLCEALGISSARLDT